MLSTFEPLPALTAAKARRIRARLQRYETWIRETFGDTPACYKSNAVPRNCRVTNAERSALETYDWLNDPPRVYFTYVFDPDNADKRRIGTWPGESLGRVTYMGVRVRDNFGGFRRYLTVRGTNGIRYWGWYYESAGDYCRIRAYKGQIPDGKE